MQERRGPVWDYLDFALFLGAVLPSWGLAFILSQTTRSLAPRLFSNDAVKTLVFQSFMYVFLVGSLYLVIAWRYHQPFWRSLGWTFPIPRVFQLLALGSALAVALSVLAVILHAPMDGSQIEILIKGRASLAAITLFGVVLAPIFEEMLFRGFLLPLLVRSLGPALGILFTAVPFALLHGAQNHWAWQPVLLIGIAGVSFGYARYKTGSTTAAFLMHSAYNAMGFLGYTLTHWGTLS